MNFDDPNRPVRGVGLRDGERYLGAPAGGNAGRDGYTVCAKRPRLHGADMMEPDRADRIEQAMRDFPLYDD